MELSRFYLGTPQCYLSFQIGSLHSLLDSSGLQKGQSGNFQVFFNIWAWMSQNVTLSTFDWSKQSQAQPKFQRRHKLHLLMGWRRHMCVQEQRNWRWPSLEISSPTSFVRLLGPWETQLCLFCSPLDPLLLCLTCTICENIYCTSEWTYSVKVCNFLMRLFPLTRIHFSFSLC